MGIERNSFIGERRQLHQNMQNNQLQRERVAEQISTGKRLQTPTQDPRGYSVVRMLRNDQEQILRSQEQAQLAHRLNKETQNGLLAIKEFNQNALERVAGLSGPTKTEDCRFFAGEINAQIENCICILNKKDAITQRSLFGGGQISEDAITVTRVNGIATAVQYVGQGEAPTLAISESMPNFNPQATAAQAQTLADSINHLIALRDALNQFTPQEGIGAIDQARQQVQADEDVIRNITTENILSELTIQSALKLQQTQFKHDKESISHLEDADFLSAINQASSYLTAFQACSQVFGLMNKTSILNYIQ